MSKRKGAKFGEGSAIRADWLCIGCPKLVDGRKAGNSNRGLFFCTGLYTTLSPFQVKLKSSLVRILCGLATFDNVFLVAAFFMFTLPALSQR